MSVYKKSKRYACLILNGLEWSFELTVNPNLSECEFSPLKVADVPGLPPFVRETILFPYKELPVFLIKVMNAMRK
jgi:hypothetical protein